MCLGLPGKVLAISDPEAMLATVEIGGIRREVNLACVVESTPQDLVDRWVLIHVGFALSLIDEVQAQQTLQALEQVQALQRELQPLGAADSREQGRSDEVR